jgi:hypothetical protein
VNERVEEPLLEDELGSELRLNELRSDGLRSVATLSEEDEELNP